MQYRNLGKSGLKVSTIGLGTNQFGGKVDLAGTKNIIAAALDAGVNFIDTADVYQGGRSEENIGEALKDRRDQALIATKVFFKVGEGPNDLSASRQHIMAGIEASHTYRNQWYWGGEARLRASGDKLELTTIPADEWKTVEDAALVFWDEMAQTSETAAKLVAIFREYNNVTSQAGPPYTFG